MRRICDDTAKRIGQHAEQMRRARDNPPGSPLMGLATFGMVGWTVAVPTVAGIALGLWLDRVAAQHFSWTITMLFAGLVLGMFLAWRWVMQEQREATRENRDDD